MVNHGLFGFLGATALVAVAVAGRTLIAQQSVHLADSVPDTSRTTKLDPRGLIFIQRGCNSCHAIAALGVRAKTDVGPDLTFAYADVLSRYETNLETFLSNPTGVMEMVLSSHPALDAVDRDSMVNILRALYVEHRAEMDEDVPSFPPAGPARNGGLRREHRTTDPGSHLVHQDE
jgi:hypothetical protein